MVVLQQIPEHINFPKEEEKILELWKELNAFKTSLKQSKSRPRFTFYDGPPFATGLPHYGHILAGTIKDIVTRYAHMSGYHVERRFGWDTHGLPIEYEIDKTLGITGPADVAAMGIAAYNAECRKIVMRYSQDWETIVTRMGRWIDFENDYKTMYPAFMESVWWVFSELWNKGLVYRGVKVMPFSTKCNTPLSNFEMQQNYKEVVDPAVMVSFPLDGSPGVSLIAWTTTPWTLPSNLTLCVNPKMKYVKVKELSSERVYIMMSERLSALFKSAEEYTILDTFLGDTLAGKGYTPLFPYFKELKSRGAFRVLVDGYVTSESGTGVVHQAPYFGEDDYRVCLANNVISRDQDIICPVDNSGCFMDPVEDFKGMHVKDADKHIIKHIKGLGRLVNASSTKHNYPFCWRSDTPLIYKAIPSWFIRVEPLVQQLLHNNKQTYWVPAYVQEKRFANWLRDARDWAVSRNRYWGTPIPVWVSEDMVECVCVGSIAQLEQLTNTKVTDLHRESIDHLTIPSSRPGHPPLRRVSEVFDCWFESGSMPYAQAHYPFEHKKEFDDNFPADFIAEGVDQTRGWFYTLLVLSTGLFNRPPFKNLIVNGLVLASDGKKMSKREKNYPDPMLVVHKYGADALRLYLINSPVVRAEALRFKEDGVRDVLKDVFLPWYNAFRFLIQNVELFQRKENEDFKFDGLMTTAPENVMDKWILSFTQTLLQFVHVEMAAYRLYTVIPRLIKFVDNLTNWYVRMNRKRLKGDGGTADCRCALQTLSSVLYSMIVVMAPLTPFLSELMYQVIKHLLQGFTDSTSTASVHYLMIPQPRPSLQYSDIEAAVCRMQAVIDLGRVLRDRRTMPVKYPLPEVVVVHKDPMVLEEVRSLEEYIKEELNIRSLTVTSDKQSYGVTLRAEPDHKTLGQRLKGDFKQVTQKIKELSDAEVSLYLSTGSLEVGGHTLVEGELRVMYKFEGEGAEALSEKYEAHSDNEILILLDVTPDQSMLDEGVAREIINRIQKLRKKVGLVPSDEVEIYYSATPSTSDVARVATTHRDYIQATVKMPIHHTTPTEGSHIVTEETLQIKGCELKLIITKSAPTTTQTINCSYVNVSRMSVDGSVQGAGTLLLENPRGANIISPQQLHDQVCVIFGLQGRDVSVVGCNGCKDIRELNTKTIHVYQHKSHTTTTTTTSQPPNTPFVNVEFGEERGSILLQNPANSAVIPDQQLVQLAGKIFKQDGGRLRLYTDTAGTCELSGAPTENSTLYAKLS